jgi:hypothetical protein
MPQPKKYESSAARQAAYRRRQRERIGLQDSKRVARETSVPSLPGRKRWKVMVGQALTLVEVVHREMESYYLQKSETWQESESGEAFLDLMESIQEAGDVLGEVQH